MKMSIEQFAESHKSHPYVEHYVETLRDNHIMNIESFEVETGTGHYAGAITEFAWPCEDGRVDVFYSARSHMGQALGDFNTYDDAVKYILVRFIPFEYDFE